MRAGWLLAFGFLVGVGGAQGVPEQPVPPGGKIVFSTEQPPAVRVQGSSTSAGKVPAGPADKLPRVPVTQAERAALVVAGWDLDVHLVPARAEMETHATLEVWNRGAVAVGRVVLDLSSTLRWETMSLVTPAGLVQGEWTQSPVATDTDHTGYAEEAVLTLPGPLAAGATVRLSVSYAGEIRQTSERLQLIGTPAAKANGTDWDQITAASDESATGLRGFGNVLWYPVAAPTAILGDGNKLFEAIEGQRADEAGSPVRLRLTVEYAGDPPVGAIFCGELKDLLVSADDGDVATAESNGVATAEFGRRALGFRIPSLFVTAQRAMMTEGQNLAVITPRGELTGRYGEAAGQVRGLLAGWVGESPSEPAVVMDHAGEPFEDGALLVMPLAGNATAAEIAPRLVRAMARASLRSAHPWISEGFAEFARLLWMERTRGREAAVAELGETVGALAVSEPEAGGGQALVDARSEVFYRGKAAAVWWQMREIVGESTLQEAVGAYRRSERLNPGFDGDPRAFQKTLEKVAKRDLGWFFEDWVYRDRGLPDLAIVQVNARVLPARPGKNAGYLVAVEVRNDGGAVAEVPVTVRSGSLSATERLRIGGQSLASTRIVFEGVPETVTVNDGGTPEVASSVHVKVVQVR